jgi:hypothetical protein
MLRAVSLRTETIWCGAQMLRTAIGSVTAAWLQTPPGVEVVLNPDGGFQLDRMTKGSLLLVERSSTAIDKRIRALIPAGADRSAIGRHQDPYRCTSPLCS